MTEASLKYVLESISLNDNCQLGLSIGLYPPFFLGTEI